MYEKLKRRLAGALSFDILKEKSHAWIQTILSSEKAETNFAFKKLRDNQDWFDAWWERHCEILKKVADAENGADQILKLRRATVDQIEAKLMAGPFLTDELSEEDKKVLARALGRPDSSSEDTLRTYVDIWVVTEASVQCLRLLAFELGDAKKNDWYDMYCDAYSQFLEHMYQQMIAKAKDDVYVMEAFLPALRQILDQAKEKIFFAGENWDYDKEAMEREREQEEQEEAEAEAERKAKEPPKQRVVKNSQIEDLAEYLYERYERLKNGELYKVQGYSPTNAVGVIQIDTGIMLIALTECLEDKETAIKAIKTVTFKMFEKAGSHTEELKESDVNVDEQLAILEMKEENEEEGWLASVSVLATFHLYDINPEDLDKKERTDVGRASTGNLGDAWEVYATTKNVFGYDYNPTQLKELGE